MVLRKNFILKKLGTIQSFPVLPDTVFALAKALDENRELPEIIALAERDVALTTNVLKLVNSAYYRGPSRAAIGNLEEAIVRLGLHEFERVALSFSALHSFKGFGTGAVFADFWKHSMIVAGTCARAYEILYEEKLDRRAGRDLYTLGLLHDVGILILDFYFPELYQRVVKHFDRKLNLDLPEFEFDVLGLTHEDIGAWAMARWNLPQLFIDCIGHHHREGYQGPYTKELRVLRLVNDMTTCHETGTLATYDPSDLTLRSELEELQFKLKVRFVTEEVFRAADELVQQLQ